LCVKVRAPGKIIFFGEYAVVYGHRAYIQALPYYTYCQLTWDSLSHKVLTFSLKNLTKDYTKDYDQLREDYKAIQERYCLFLEHKHQINCVLMQPEELIEAVIAQSLTNPVQGLKVFLESELSLNSGQGSSAALIVSSLVALKIMQGNPFQLKDIFDEAVSLEGLQHGVSSGLDIAAALYGGLFSYQHKVVQSLGLDSFDFYLVSTGTPLSTTGECVSFVKQRWNALYDQRYKIIDRLVNNFFLYRKKDDLREAIKSNHSLLTDLGVVPKRVQEFVRSIEKNQGVAKISGSGSILGETAGMVIVIDCSVIEQLCNDYGYTYQQIKGVGTGVTSL
jgi:hydroxymethylglutaryl-CoA synthase